MKTKNLSLKIVIALILGITIGSIFNMFAQSGFVVNVDKYVFNVIGQIFLNLIFTLLFAAAMCQFRKNIIPFHSLLH